MVAVVRQFLHPTSSRTNLPHSSPSLHHFNARKVTNFNKKHIEFPKLSELSADRTRAIVFKSSATNNDIVQTNDNEDGVSLGTMKLPANIDIPRFETLLFQWANSLCQGANLPLPLPLKVDKIRGGARLGFITIGNGETEVLVYIDCLIYPATESSGPVFRAIRNGNMKDRSPPGEPRIMRSLLEALKKSVEIARV